MHLGSPEDVVVTGTDLAVVEAWKPWTKSAQAQRGACDAVGFGRPAVAFPDLPSKIVLNDKLSDEETRFDVEPAPVVPGWIASRIRSVGAGTKTVSLILLSSSLVPDSC
ncbi:hypothetical protein C8A05DRAFT_20417 [Staphylotrichum tortipilum]|uniref:Uncharacterized protein n=1 Tax=Staphylotrichum tortipilum TaxID=2831512 RepID=A0AAN6M8Q7_9PEZI|nr:hypothetical protein C8A05DRAFT_20417 [Staphylotrichum longicolle]